MKNNHYTTSCAKNSFFLPRDFRSTTGSFFILCIVFLITCAGKSFAQTFTTPGAGTFVVPTGVTAAQVECWGGGGGAGGTSGGLVAANASGGGGGGAYAKSVVAVSGSVPYVVGAGGAGGAAGNNAGIDGTSSTWNGTTVVARFGIHGNGSSSGSSSAGGAGGSIALSTGTVRFAGGNGAAGTAGSIGGGGGGGAGNANAGGNASAGTAGTGGAAGGGNGGAGISNNGTPNPGVILGGGGGGNRSTALGTARPGGAGARGQIVVTYPTITSLGSTSGCSGSSLTINGTNLSGAVASGVTIGGIAVSSITSNTGTVMVVVPAVGSSGTVSVTSAVGTYANPAFTYSLLPTPVLTATPSGQSVCNGVAFSDIALSSSVGGTSLSWSSNSPAGIGGAPLSGSTSPISGTFTNSNTTPTNVTFTINGSAAGCNAVAITATVTVNPTTMIASQPVLQNICETQNASFTVGATGAGLTYQWQEQIGAGAFNNISNTGVYSGADSPTLVITGPPIGMSTNNYQCIVTGTCGVVTSTPVSLTVNPTPVISVSTATQTVCAGVPISDITFSDINGASTGSSTFSFTSTTPGGIGGTVPTSGTASPISGTYTSTNSTPTTVTFTINSSLGSCNAVPVTSDVIVNPGVAITTQPADQTICQTYDVTFHIAVSGGGITYMWQEQIGGVGAFNDIVDGGAYSGATSPSLSIVNPAIGMSTNNYQCVINSACGSLTSDPAVLTINPTPDVTALPSIQTICSGSSISNIVLTDNNALTAGSTFYGLLFMIQMFPVLWAHQAPLILQERFLTATLALQRLQPIQ